MNKILWAIQILLALLFLFAGGAKFVMPVDQMTKAMPAALASLHSYTSLAPAKYWVDSVSSCQDSCGSSPASRPWLPPGW